MKDEKNFKSIEEAADRYWKNRLSVFRVNNRNEATMMEKEMFKYGVEYILSIVEDELDSDTLDCVNAVAYGVVNIEDEIND